MKLAGGFNKDRLISIVAAFKSSTIDFCRRRKAIILGLIVFFIATLAFFWPAITHPSTYSEGGDHMFNAWTLARDHNCILRNGCPSYVDGNIFFPHKDTMLYSETQISAGFLTLPLHFVNSSPLFSANIWYFVSALCSGFFMYLLAYYLSKGNNTISILSGLIFEFAPTKITAMPHLQNLSIFYLPLIILLLLKYKDGGQKKYLYGMFVACSLLFLASWYQMVFGLVVVGMFTIYAFITDRKRGLYVGLAVLLALLTTLPLATQYLRFSKETKSSFSLMEQVQFSSSIDDYLIPGSDTLLGEAYYSLRPNVQQNSHNPDSYSYAGIVLYLTMLGSIAWVLVPKKFKTKKKYDLDRPMTLLLGSVFVVGMVMSLGPLVKIGGQYIFNASGYNIVVPAPYIFVSKFLPQLSFIRAIGRASVIALFALCCMLAASSILLKNINSRRLRGLLTILLVLVISFELLPFRKIIGGPFQTIDVQKTSYTVPAIYEYIKDNEQIDNLIVLRTEKDYPSIGTPTAMVEDVLWSGYDNRNLFNGYSGYEPKEYASQYKDFVDFREDDISKLKSLGLRYVLVDKLLSAKDSNLVTNTEKLLTSVKADDRYTLYTLN